MTKDAELIAFLTDELAAAKEIFARRKNQRTAKLVDRATRRLNRAMRLAANSHLTVEVVK
jgi:hypothetical protein